MLVRVRRHDWQVGAGSQYFQPAVHSDGCVAARLRLLHSLWHAAPCRNELFSPAVEASSKSFAHLPRHGPRRRPTSGKPSSQPGEPTMPLTCIRKRSTDGLRCEGTWACARGRSKDRLGLPRVECDHTFLRWQQYSQSKICLRLRALIRVRNRPPREHYRTGLSREQMSFWFAGYPKTAGLQRPVWVELRRTQPERIPSGFHSEADLRSAR